MPDIPAPTPISTADTRSPEAKDPAPTSGNAAANGYWLHDAGGPRHYVAPPAGQSATDADVAPLVDRVRAALAAVGQAATSGITAAFEADEIVMTGTAPSTSARSSAVAAVTEAAGDIRVTDRIGIRETPHPQEAKS